MIRKSVKIWTPRNYHSVVNLLVNFFILWNILNELLLQESHYDVPFLLIYEYTHMNIELY